MNTKNIKKFIEDFRHKSHFYNKKDLFSQYFLRGDFKKGFTLLFQTDFNQYQDYYFNLDSEDLSYLIGKYTPIYENIVEQEKSREIAKTKSTIEELNNKLKQLTNE